MAKVSLKCWTLQMQREQQPQVLPAAVMLSPISVFVILMSSLMALLVCGAASANTYYVATSGNDTNPGTSLEKPFATIQRAATAMTAGDTCLIGTGTYRETVAPANGGLPGKPITFQALPGATPVISGLEPVSGWTQCQGSIYSAPFPSSLADENQVLIVDGLKVNACWEARWPKIPEYSLKAIHDNMAIAQQATGTSLTDSQIPGNDGSWKGATLWVRGGSGGWLPETIPITGYDATTHTLTFDKAPIDDDTVGPRAKAHYFLSGTLAALDSPGEWYVDEAAHKIYLWAPTGGVPKDVEAKRRVIGFNLSGKSYVVLRSLHLLGCTVKMDGSNNCVLDRLNSQYLYQSSLTAGYDTPKQQNNGIDIRGNDNTISNSEIAYSSGSAVHINGADNKIVNNHIHDTNYCGGYSGPIFIATGFGTLIAHNTINDSGRYGIYMRTGDVIIRNNVFYNEGWLTKDSGAIYCYGVDMANSLIHNNVIHDGRGEHPSIGIYLDNYTENAVVYDNVLYNLPEAIRLNTPGQYRLIFNNTAFNCDVSFAYWGQDPYGSELYGTKLYNNILSGTVKTTPDMMSANNLVSSRSLFVDPDGDDFRLAPHSAAIGAGVPILWIVNGQKPDCGAFQSKEVPWHAGADFDNPPSEPAEHVYTPGMNLLANGGFEYGTSGWADTGAAEATTVGATGTGTLNRGRNSMLRLGPDVGGITQRVQRLMPSTAYTLAGWCYVDAGESAEIRLTVTGRKTLSFPFTGTDYARGEIQFTTGPGRPTATVEIVKTSTGPGHVYADDFGLVEGSGR